MKKTNHTFLKTNENCNRTFTEIHYINKTLIKYTFEGCTFNHCNFSETNFIQCKFVDCEFITCNLSACKFDGSSIERITFYDSKVIGINWTKLNWPLIPLVCPFQFNQCNISHSSFFNLMLSHLIIKACKSHDVDFREANLSHANLCLTDFSNSQFMRTDLTFANFIEATNYQINPNENHIQKAKFDLPDAINLLSHLDIDIQH